MAEELPQIAVPSPTEDERVRIREAVGVVRSREILDTVVRRLEAAGFDRADIDLMGSPDTVRRHTRGVLMDPLSAAEMPEVPRRPVLTSDDDEAVSVLVFGTLLAIGTIGAAMPIIATGGAIAAALAAAAGGGAVAAGLAEVIRRRILPRSAVDLEDEMRQGGLVIMVRIRRLDREAVAMTALTDGGADHVHVHEVEVSRSPQDVPFAGIRLDPWLSDEKIGG
jgi:hypothetical protein